MLESDIVAAIFKKVLNPLEHAFFFKVHGGPFQKAGIPDIVGCYRGRFVAIEVKMPDKSPTKLQLIIIQKLHQAGAAVGVARSVEDAQNIIALVTGEEKP